MDGCPIDKSNTPFSFPIISIAVISNFLVNFRAISKLSTLSPGHGKSAFRFSYAESINSFPNFFNSSVEIVSKPNNPSNIISPTKTKFGLKSIKLLNSDTESCSGIKFLIISKFLLVVNIEGLGIDFCSYFENRIDSIFFTDFDVLRTTSSIGLEISNASSLDSISESERVFPSTSIFCSRFSALMSKTTSVLP